MAYTPVPSKADGDPAYTAGDINTYIKANWLAGIPDLFTAAGQLCYSTASDTGAALTVGTVGYNLKSTGSLPAWTVHPVKDVVTTKGDLVVGTGIDAIARLAVGATNGFRLIADSSQTTGLRWGGNNAEIRTQDAGSWGITSGSYSTMASFTIPVTGYYAFLALAWQLNASDAWATGEKYIIDVYNSDTTTVLSVLGEMYFMAAAVTAKSTPAPAGWDILYLTAGATILVRAYQDTGSYIAMPPGGGYGNVSIIRLGV